jgi:hypothetical protein
MIFRKLRVTTLLKVIAACSVCTSASAFAATDDAMIPLLMKYELCAHSTAARTQDLVRARCTKERSEIILTGRTIVDRFYPSARLEANRQLELELTGTERYAALLERSDRSYGPEVLKYIACLSENALSDPDYIRGKVLYGRPIAKKRRPVYDQLVGTLRDTAAGRTAKLRLAHLNSTFVSLYATPVTGFDAGFIGFHVE